MVILKWMYFFSQLDLCKIWRKKGRNFFYLTTHSTHFIYSYMASDIWLRIILIVIKETCCRHIGYSFRFFYMHHPTDRIAHTMHDLCYTSHGALAGTRNTSMGPPHEGSIRWPIIVKYEIKNVLTILTLIIFVYLFALVPWPGAWKWTWWWRRWRHAAGHAVGSAGMSGVVRQQGLHHGDHHLLHSQKVRWDRVWETFTPS